MGYEGEITLYPLGWLPLGGSADRYTGGGIGGFRSGDLIWIIHSLNEPGIC